MRCIERAARGQSTVEYLLVIVAVLLAVMYGVRTVLQKRVEARMTDAGTLMDNAGDELKKAIAVTP